MARITVEDCLDNVENRFQLVLVAAKRARQIANGSEPRLPIDKDKPTVVALREIAEGLTGPAILTEVETTDSFFGEETRSIVEEPAAENDDDITSRIAALMGDKEEGGAVVFADPNAENADGAEDA
ncbi:unnamed protein product [Cyprideis torosa]|uniref:DNA-directed RNA polymerase n=1 Tax=Cyprideis torosa TaxID=163714 RepID=A0A7R8WVJ2_9CRUS|nr:unnamed protein product [Cyprideis torosa]CAG0911231.1 unnamed protein product [Cyprideis torosa]